MPTNSKKKRTLVARYSDLSFDGFKYHPSPTYVQSYAGSFVGKDFKSFIQVAPFALCGVVSDADLQLWITVAKIVKILYVCEIYDLPKYCSDLSAAVNNIYGVMAAYATDILHKPKVHMLFHAITHINRFGPLMLSATEKEEQKNGKVRKILFQTNRRNPSRDVAIILAGQEGLQTVTVRGIWRDPATDKFVSSGDRLLQTVKKHPEIRRMVGIEDGEEPPSDIESEGWLFIVSNLSLIYI